MQSESRTASPGRSSPQDALTYLHLSLATLFWAGVFVAGKIALEVVDPIFLATARFVVAALAVGVVVLFARGFVARTRAEIATFAWIGFLGVFAYNIAFTIALDWSSPLHGLVIIATTPAWTALLAVPLLGAKVTRAQIAGFALAFTAVLLVVLVEGEGEGEASDYTRASLSGDLLFVAAAIVWALYTIESRKALASTDAATLTGWSLVLGALMLVPVALAFSDVPAMAAAMRPFDWAAVLYMGVFATLGAFLLWSKGVAAIGPARAAVFLNLVPIWGAILTAFAFLAAPPLHVLAAMALAIAGVVAVQRGGR